MRAFVIMALICIAVALIYQAAGCQKSTDGCAWNPDAKTYSCPDER